MLRPAPLLLASLASAQAALTPLRLPGEHATIEALGDDGRIAGAVHLDAHALPFVREPNGTITLLPLPDGRQGGVAVGLAPGGAVFGFTDDGALLDGRALLWRPGEPPELLEQAWSARGADIALGAVRGEPVGLSYEDGLPRTVIWSAQGPRVLAPHWHAARLADVSSTGWLVGDVHADGRARFWVRPPGAEHPVLPDLPPDARLWSAAAVTDRGTVLGAWFDPQTGRTGPFLWSEAEALTTIEPPRAEEIALHDIDERRRAVGRRRRAFLDAAVLWTPRHGFIDAQALLAAPDRDRWIIHECTRINARGEILARVSSRDPAEGVDHAPALLTLCPADFNLDARTDLLDLIAYLDAFREGDPYANLQDPADSPLDVRDLMKFLRCFRECCSGRAAAADARQNSSRSK